LKVWWPLLSAEFGSERVSPRFQRKYLWYKAISEACKIYLFICHGKRVYQREAALAMARQYLDLEQNCYINKVQHYLKTLASREDLAEDGLMEFFVKLSGKAFGEMERELYGGSKGRKVVLNNFDYNDSILENDVFSLIEKLKMYIKRELEPYLEYVALIPQVEFSLDVLYNSDIDSFHLLLIERDFMPVEKLKRVSLLCEENTSRQGIEPFIIYGNIALSLKAGSWYQCIRSPKQSPLFFSLLSQAPLVIYEKSDETKSKSAKFDLPPNAFEEIIRRRARGIDAAIANKNIYKMKTLDFLRFFWGAARTKVLARFVDSHEIHIPVTSKQIRDMLIQFSPENSTWLNDIYMEYRKELVGRESGAYRFFIKSVDLLKSI